MGLMFKKFLSIIKKTRQTESLKLIHPACFYIGRTSILVRLPADVALDAICLQFMSTFLYKNTELKPQCSGS